MKVLLQKNVSKLGKIGEIVEVKPGYARNYLIPHGIAMEPTRENLRAIEIDKQRYLEELAKQRKSLEAQIAVVAGKEVTIPARANKEGQLYGSVGPAQIVAALAAENIFIDPENIVLDEQIRRLDRYEITIRFAEDITTTIHVWIVPISEQDADLDDSSSQNPEAVVTEEPEVSEPQREPSD